MRKISTLVAILVVTGSTLGMYEVAGADDGSSGGSASTIHLVEKDAGFTDVDLGDKGEGPGDEEIFTQDLFDTSGHAVGHAAGVCVVVSESAVQCHATDVINGDQLLVAGLIDFDDSGFTVAIVGGTGRFHRARGEEVIKESDGGQSITIRLA